MLSRLWLHGTWRCPPWWSMRPTPRAVTESTPRSPTAAPGGSSPPDLSNGVIANNAATLLSLLPLTENASYGYLNAETLLERPAFADYLPSWVEDSYYWTANYIDDNFLNTVNVRGYASVTGLEEELRVSMFLGDFEDFHKELRGDQGPPDGIVRDGISVPVNLYRGVEVFNLLSNNSIGIEGYTGNFATVFDTSTLLLSYDEAALHETVDRLLDGGQANPAMERLFHHMERVDLFTAYVPPPEIGGQSDDPSIPVFTFSAHAGFLNQGESTTLYAYTELLEGSHAKQLMETLSEESDVDVFFRRYSGRTARPQGEFWQDGRAIVARAVVPDDDVGDLISSN